MGNVRVDEIQLNINVNGVRAGQTLKDLRTEVRDLKRGLDGLEPGSEAFLAKLKQIGEKQAVIESVNSAIKQVSNTLNGAGNSMSDFLKKAAGFAGIQLGFQELFGFMKQFGSEAISAGAKTSDALADMEKATNLTKEQVRALNDELARIDTRSTQEELQGIAIVGGQLNVPTAELVDFVKQTDEAAVALKDEFAGGAEEVTKKLGILKNLFGSTKELTYGNAIRTIGSAINGLGAAGQATGPVMAEFAARIGQLGNLAPELNATLALGATLEELGLSAEIGASGVGQILLTASKDTAGFAKQLGLTDAAFKQLINTKPDQVIDLLAKSLKGASNTNIVATLDNLGIKSQEAIKVVSSLSSNTKLYTDRLALSNDLIAKGTSLHDEFTKKNENEAAQLAKANKQYEALKVTVGEFLIPAYLKLTTAGLTFIGILRAIPEFVSENRATLLALAIALVSFNAAQIAATASTLYASVVLKGQTIATQAAAVAQRLLNGAMTANPIGLVITAVALLVAGFIELYERSETVRAGIAGLGAVAKEVFAIIKESVAAFVSGFEKLKNGDIKGGLADFGKGIIKSNPIGIAFSEGARLGDAFNKGYADKLASEKTKPKVAAKATAGKQTAPDGTVVDDDDVLTKKQQKELDKQEKQREAAAKKAAKAREKDNAERIRDEEAAQKKIEELEVQAIADESLRKSAQAALNAQRAIQEITASQATEEQKNELIKAADLALARELADIDKDAAEKKLKLAQQALEKETALRRRAATAEADLAIIMAGRNEAKLLEARTQKIQTLRDIELENTELTENEKILIKARAEAEIDALREENAQKEKQRQQELMESFGNLAQGGLQAIGDFSRISSNKEIADAERTKNAKLLKLKQELAAKRITQEQYDFAVSQAEDQADKKTRELKRKQAKTDKAVAISESIIKGALAVVAALGQGGPILAAIVGILAGLQTATIIATPIPEFARGGFLNRSFNRIRQFATGGFVRNAGVPRGPSHAGGGIDLVDTSTGSTIGNMEGNEPIMVLSKATYANNRDVVDKLLDSSLYGGGRKVRFADGGVIGSATLDRTGGDSSSAMVGLLAQIEQNTANFPTQVRGVWVLSDLQKAETLQGEIEADSSF